MIPTGGCALANLLADADPIGSATSFDHLFLLQVPPPWNRIALTGPNVPPGVREALVPAAQAGLRAYALLVDGGAEPLDGEVRILHYARGAGPARSLARGAYAAAPERVAAAIEALARDATPDGVRVLAESPARELLVCTHGERDDCCGRFGEAAFAYLRRRHAGPLLSVWRASHFGGHRFAPTLIDLPDGRCWGRLSQEACDALVRRSGAPGDLAACYRGWCALPPEAQVGERDLFFAAGWSWLSAEVASEVRDADGAGTKTVRLTYRQEGGPAGSRLARVTPIGEAVAPASCGADESRFVRYRCSWERAASPVAG